MELYDELINSDPDPTMLDQAPHQDEPERRSCGTLSDHPANFVDRSVSSSRPSGDEAQAITRGHGLEFTVPAGRSSNMENVARSVGDLTNEDEAHLQGQTNTPPEDSRSGIWSGRQLWRPVLPRPRAQSITPTSPSDATQHGGLVRSNRRRHSNSRTQTANNHTRLSANLTCQCGAKCRTSSELRYVCKLVGSLQYEWQDFQMVSML